MAEKGADVGGHPAVYPVAYKVQRLIDGLVLKLSDAADHTAEVVMTVEEAYVLAARITGAASAAAPHKTSGMIGAALDYPGGHR